MSLEDNFNNIDKGRVDRTISKLAEDGMFRYPIGIEAVSRVLDDVFDDLYSLHEMGFQMVKVLSDPSQGWTEEQAKLLGTGVDMALIILHELILQEREARSSGNSGTPEPSE